MSRKSGKYPQVTYPITQPRSKASTSSAVDCDFLYSAPRHIASSYTESCTNALTHLFPPGSLRVITIRFRLPGKPRHLLVKQSKPFFNRRRRHFVYSFSAYLPAVTRPPRHSIRGRNRQSQATAGRRKENPIPYSDQRVESDSRQQSGKIEKSTGDEPSGSF